MYCIVLYCTVLYCTVPHCTVLYCTVMYSPVLKCTVLYCIVLYCITLYYIVLHVLHCTTLYYTVLYCTALSLLYSDKLSQTCHACEIPVLYDIVIAFLKSKNLHYFHYPFPFFFPTPAMNFGFMSFYPEIEVGSLLKSVFSPYRIYSDDICYSQSFLVPKISTVNPLCTLHGVKLCLLAAGLYGNTASSFQARPRFVRAVHKHAVPACITGNSVCPLQRQTGQCRSAKQKIPSVIIIRNIGLYCLSNTKSPIILQLATYRGTNIL
jgi:hypothetical protein